MIAITQVIMKIFSASQLLHMKLMAHNTQTVRKKLFAIDQKKNISFFRVLPKLCSCCMMVQTIYLLIMINYPSKKTLLIQSIREFFILYFHFYIEIFYFENLPIPYIYWYVFSLHLFKNYGNKGDCLDMELSYYLECSSLVQTGQSDTVAFCQANGEFTFIIGLWHFRNYEGCDNLINEW